MGSIDDIANDPEWQPSLAGPVATLPVQVREPVGRERITTNVEVVVRALENGLLYATALDENGMPTLARGSYSVENFPKGNSPYQLINLARFNREDVPGFSATFEYKAGKTPKGIDEKFPAGLDEVRIEYTTWHNPIYNLTLLTSVQAHQLIKEGWLDAQLSLPTYGNSERAMTMEVSSLSESLKFSRDGAFLEKSTPRLFWSSKELKGIYQAITKGAQIDPLQTAVALINGFPKQRPLHIEKLIQYKSPTTIR